MKTTKLLIVFTIIAVFFLSSCDNPIGLHNKLDLDGPVVEFTSPVARKAVLAQFTIEGTATDQSGVETLKLTAERLTEDSDKEPVAQQWRYTKRGWEISKDFGANWEPLSGAAWEGSVYDAVWSIPIDMSATPDGEYQFMVTAEDVGGQADDNSFKTRVLIVDKTPPAVKVFDPNVYFDFRTSYVSATDTFSHLPLQELHALTEDDPAEIGRRNYINIGKFLTRGFDMKWEIIDQYDIWSVDILFCDLDAPIDGLPETPIAGDKIYYRYQENLPPPPVVPQPANNVKPNGTAKVPDLNSAPGKHPGTDGEIFKSVTTKTTIRVVAVCYDVAGNPNNEKTIGYFVYWPKADEPWIDYAEGMDNPWVKGYFNKPTTEFEQEVAMFYPGRSIKANAFQAHGVGAVTYEVYKCAEDKDGDKLILTDTLEKMSLGEKPNPPRGGGIYSTNFPWDFTPPVKPGFYVVKAKVTDSGGKYGDDEFSALFQIQDVSFPDFPIPPTPAASDPLYKAIEDGDITISGLVSDSTGVISLLMVWINPDSKGYATMSQLEYFRDPNYPGWTQAAALAEGDSPIKEFEVSGGFPGYPDYPYDKNGNQKYNKLWHIKLPTTDPDLYTDPNTSRQVYKYSQVVRMEEDLGIGIGKADLRSQMFLLRAENQGGKTAIITYAPQGDALPPKVEIIEVVAGTAPNSETIPKGSIFKQIPKFPDAGTTPVVIKGTWEEDSTEYLESDDYFYDSFRFSINGKVFDRHNKMYNDMKDTSPNSDPDVEGITVTFSPTNANDPAKEGTFEITVNVSSTNTLKPEDLRDTLAVNVFVRDYGGNPSEDGASWLIQSDNLQFVRISSDDEDRAYRATGSADGKIRIFVEFNKPVVWVRNPSTNPTNIPYLKLNSHGTTAYAIYDVTQTSENTKHYFDYTVGSSDNINVLNVNGISINGTSALTANDDTEWKNANYNFTFLHTAVGGESYEEIRLTTNTSHDELSSRTPVTTMSTDNKKVYARMLPVTTTTGDDDYMRTLGAGKHISIDNTPPQITGITATPQGWHKAGTPTEPTNIYITATFDEPVKISSVPRLTLGVANGGTRQTTNDANDIRVSGNQITFRYIVANNDNTGTNALTVTGISGTIQDIPGNSMPTTPFTTQTLTGVYLDNTAPAVPTVTVYAGASGSEAPKTGTLGTLYDDSVFIRVTATGTVGDNINLGKVEYSLNNGTDWATSTSTTLDTDIPVNNKGVSNVMVRQTDRAGNATTSGTTTFTWDPGPLISRISSTSANGVYTHNTGRNSINVTVTFRKPLTFTAGTPTITHNAKTTSNTITTSNPANATNTLSFTYTVVSGDATPTGSYFDVTNINGFTTVRDGSAGNVNISSYLNGILPTAGTEARLAENKQITVDTTALTRNTMSFTNLTGDGIQQSDGSYWTTLLIPFNRAISKGSGEITIVQIAAGYRLPAVLTEAQYNRFRGVANFDTYYTKGTNGYINGQGSDTSAKYVLNYQWNPDSAVTANNIAFPNNPNNADNGDRFIPAAFFSAFRTAETITINVNSQSVEVSGDTLRVRLNGSNAPQVPGATYQVTYPAGLVNDSLGNTSAAATAVVANQVALGGVAKPFVRIRKTQDTITNSAAPSATVPRLSATQPRYAYVRMDSRTPNATIQYTATEHTYTAADNNWSTTGGPNYNTTTVVTGGTTFTNPTTVTLTRPGNPANNFTNNMQIPAAGETGIKGYKWWVRARATVGGVNSLETEEMAYRTAITYRLRSNDTNGAEMAYPQANGSSEVTSGQQRVGGGDQIWIRGGDAIGSSTIAGFPFTWKDDWTSLSSSNKRAGIRLMTLRGTNSTPATAGTASLNNSTWEFMTWDMNAIAYVDFILGRDGTTFTVANTGAISNVQVANVTLGTATYDVSSNNEAWQYGPRLWAYHRGGWTGSNTQYAIYPGEHRWLDIGQQTGGIPINFSSVFESRPDLTNSVMPNPNTN